jgi:hypothetical protein
MSLSDYIKYLRAVNGGATPWEIAEACGVPAGEIHLIEVKHRRVGEDDSALEKLASYFNVEPAELTGRREAYRKLLTQMLEECKQNSTEIAVKLESGEEIEGTVAWYSREAVALVPRESGEESSPYIVQRPWVADWRRAGEAEWQVASAVQAMKHNAGLRFISNAIL